MKRIAFFALALAWSSYSIAQSVEPTQQTAPPPSEQAPPTNPDGTPATPEPESSEIVSSGPAEAEPVDPSATTGTWVNGMGLNDILGILVRKSGYQYFDNPSLNVYRVTGNLLNEAKTIEQLDELVFPYNLTIYKKGNTLFALTPEQVGELPRKQFMYSVKYLRAGSLPEITGLTGSQPESVETNTTVNEPDWLGVLRSVMTSGTGLIRFEPQTGTLVVIDHEFAIERVKALLDQLDKPRRQVIVKVRILRLFANKANRFGVDWSQSLGEQGTSIGVTIQGSLDQIFSDTPVFGNAASVAQNVADAVGGDDGDGGTGDGGTGDGGTGTGGEVTTTDQPGIILSPIRLTAVLRALQEADVAQQDQGPTIITEDRLESVFRVVDRIPIVTQTVTQSNGVNNISTDVRYYIDEQDPVNDPANSREVGVRIAVTPQLLPDNMIRLDLAPYVATVTRYTSVATGVEGFVNQYPNVNETAANTSVRIPDGYSLLIGGYYQWDERELENKVPLLGDLPLISFAFRSKQKSKIRSNVIFIITPTAYDPASKFATSETTERLEQQMTAKRHMDYPDDDLPGENAEPNIFQRLTNLFPGKPKRVNDNPLSVDNPANQNQPELKTQQQIEQERIVESFVRDENGQLQPVRRPQPVTP